MSNLKIAIVVSRFNPEITDELHRGALQRLLELGVLEKNIFVCHVPGAVELPFAAQQLAITQQYHAVITLGAVIRGDTDHYDYVCQQVSFGCQKVMLDYNLPVIFGVLTTHDMQQAQDRIGGQHGHKGVYCADAALEMIALQQGIYNDCTQSSLNLPTT